MYEFSGYKIDLKESEEIIDKFKAKYIDKSYPERILLVNHLNKVNKSISLRKLRDIPIPKHKDIFMYHERLKTLYITNFQEICLYIEQLDPWEDVDCLVFDTELEWFLGITHNETVLVFGL